MVRAKKQIEIFNLEFPPYVTELTIGKYLFKRVHNYQKSYNGMMHLVNVMGSEFNSIPQTGSHQITALVTIPLKEKKAHLPRGNKDSTELDDILILLSLFTSRNVFKKNWESDYVAIIGDHRMHAYGGSLRISMEHKTARKNKKTGLLKTDDELAGIPMIHNYYNRVDIGFEKTLNKVLKLIASKKRQEEFQGGHFLLLFLAAIHRQILETSFITCRTIREHIFAIKNKNRLDDKTIEKMSGDEKIAYILNQYFFKNISTGSRKNIQKLKNTRNRIIHFGQKTKDIDYKEMDMFIRLTEQLIAIILGLKPSNIFNSFEDLEVFLNKK